MPVIAEPLVHNQETSAQSDSIPTYGELLRHSCLPAFNAALAIYEVLDDGKPNSRDDRLKWCRTSAWFYRNIKSGEVRVGSNACHLRWCPVCAQSKRNHITHAVGEWISKQRYPKFITFTMKHADVPLEFQIADLYAAFREIRRRKEFRAKVKGGVWFFQIKKSDTDGLWHPHLHCLVTGLYFYQKKLSRMWAQVTCGSTVVDIRSVHDPQAAANDVARYASSPGTLVNLSLKDGCELVGALHGRRICGTWGSGRALSLRPPKQTDKDQWVNVGDWYKVLETQYTDPNAMAIINAWQDKQPLAKGIHCCEVLGVTFMKKTLATLWDTLDEVQKSERSPP